MRKAIVSLSVIVALAGTACGNKTSAPATSKHPQAAAATKPQPAASPQVDQKTPRSAAVTKTKTKKAARHAVVAKTVKTETTGQKPPASEALAKGGPG